MIDYSNMPDDNAPSRRWGGIATAIYFVVIVLSMWLVQCNSRVDEIENASSGSLIISFGEVAESSGKSQKSIQAPSKPTAPKPTPKPTPQLTDERNEVETPQPKPVAKQEVTEAKPTETVEEIVEAKPREVNRRALFPGTSNTPQDKGEGKSTTAPAKGVAGSERGTPGVRSDLGDGLTGDYSLAGRSLIGALPVPNYTTQAEGRVVIAITVDEKGRVTSASLQLASSTTNNSRLITAAREAALKARFNQSEEFVQSGTITYIFKLN